MTKKDEPEVIDPEVLPPEGSEDAESSRRRFRRTIIAGLVIDLVDFVLRGPIGLSLGFPVGCFVGLIMGRYIGLSWLKTFVLGLVAGIYCAFPGTFFLPLGTVVALLRGGSRVWKRL
jgi:hypothetical protein